MSLTLRSSKQGICSIDGVRAGLTFSPFWVIFYLRLNQSYMVLVVGFGAGSRAMFKLSKKADYGLIVVQHFGAQRDCDPGAHPPPHASRRNLRRQRPVLGPGATAPGEREHFARAEHGNDFSYERRAAGARARRIADLGDKTWLLSCRFTWTITRPRQSIHA